MAGDIIKFGKARKAKTKAEKEQQAIANRAKFGRTREERAKEAANDKLAAERHEGLRLKRVKVPDNETPAEFAKRQLVSLKLNRPRTTQGPDDGGEGEGNGGTGGGGQS